jgi:hypothetical protein
MVRRQPAVTARIAALALLVGCAAPKLRDPHAGQFKLTFHNVTGGPVCGIHVFPFGRTEEGASWLPPNTEVSAGGVVELWVQPDTYQFHATACPYEREQITGYVPSVVMNMNGMVVLYNEADARSKDAAVALAHEHTNSTMIPAKYKRDETPAPRPAGLRSAPRSL